MCLVVIAHRAHPALPLIVAGNRDEFHGRPASAADWWPDRKNVLAGRDLEAGGTWLGIDRRGRFATVTNYRDADHPPPGLESRGHLVTDFLAAGDDPLGFVTALDGDRYAGFNLLGVADGRLVYSSNRGGGTRELDPGIYAVANATLDTPWPKVERTRQRLDALIRADDVNETTLLELLGDRATASAGESRDSSAPPGMAEALSAPFVVTPEYGTRCSVVLLDASGRLRMTEQRFSPTGETTGRSDFAFDVTARGPQSSKFDGAAGRVDRRQ